MIYKIKLKNSDQNVLLDDNVYEWIQSDIRLSEIRLLENLRLHSSGYSVFQKAWRKADGSIKMETIYLHRLVADKFLSHKRSDENPLAGTISDEKLDCRVENLTFRSRAAASRRRKSRSQTGYLGCIKNIGVFGPSSTLMGRPSI
jgi:hypothetical protein